MRVDLFDKIRLGLGTDQFIDDTLPLLDEKDGRDVLVMP